MILYFNYQINKLPNHQFESMQTNNGKNLIVELSFAFALKIIKYVDYWRRKGSM